MKATCSTTYVSRYAAEDESFWQNQLLPIQLKPEYKTSEVIAPFSLSFKNGCVLQIHSEQALSVILEKMV